MDETPGSVINLAYLRRGVNSHIARLITMEVTLASWYPVAPSPIRLAGCDTIIDPSLKWSAALGPPMERVYVGSLVNDPLTRVNLWDVRS